MTIKEYMDGYIDLDDKFKSQDGKKLSETMVECTSVWSNEAAKGYLIRAAKELNFSRDKIKEILKHMSYAFDDLTIEEAEKIYDEY